MWTRREFLMQTAAASVVAATSVRTAHAAKTTTPTQATPTRRIPGVVQTVQGPLNASKLGFTLPHEHICASSAGFMQTWPEFFGGRANFISKVVDSAPRRLSASPLWRARFPCSDRSRWWASRAAPDADILRRD